MYIILCSGKAIKNVNRPITMVFRDPNIFLSLLNTTSVTNSSLSNDIKTRFFSKNKSSILKMKRTELPNIIEGLSPATYGDVCEIAYQIRNVNGSYIEGLYL